MAAIWYASQKKSYLSYYLSYTLQPMSLAFFWVLNQNCSINIDQVMAIFVKHIRNWYILEYIANIHHYIIMSAYMPFRFLWSTYLDCPSHLNGGYSFLRSPIVPNIPTDIIYMNNMTKLQPRCWESSKITIIGHYLSFWSS